MKKEIELLAPVGDFECLKAAVQNGANAVYFGADKFNARANCKNFNKEELKEAIEYAKLRNVKTNLTVNILIKNEEFSDALELVKYAYNSGIDAIIVQDLGLAKKVIELFPDLEVHSSTQMTTYNLEGVKELEKIGCTRAVLARELSKEEIRKICENTKIEIEVFIHGALCICYSGQCLMSSIIGNRSGNRGQCAGTCRMPYELLNRENKRLVEQGYLLSSKDVCTLDIIPELISAGVKSFKIEGRMKSPYYVGGITAIYRKYIDLAQSNETYIVKEEDRKELMQLFNRGGFSTGYLKGKLGKDMIYAKQPNHLGILLGEVIGYNSNKGHVKVKLGENVDLGDSIAIGNASCKISELMDKNINIKESKKGNTVTIGRIKGNIRNGDKVYKTVSTKLNKKIESILLQENIKRKLSAKIIIKYNEQVLIQVRDILTGETVEVKSEAKAEKAQNEGTKQERIIEQLVKTGNTVFEFEDIDTEMDEGIFIPISSINAIRRIALEKLEDNLKLKFLRNANVKIEEVKLINEEKQAKPIKVSVLLNRIKQNIDYSELKNVSNIYIPLNLFLDNTVKEKINNICNKFDVYIYFPSITKSNYNLIMKNNLNNILKNRIKGYVISNLSQLELLGESLNGKDIIANYTFNAINNYTLKELEGYNFKKFIVSPELNKRNIRNLNSNMEKEVIVYGRTLLMLSEYCPIGTFKGCKGNCMEAEYALRDRLGFEFPIYTDRINCNSLIYNSKITSINYNQLEVDSIRIDIIEEENINEIINMHLSNKRFEGNNYTNGNLNKDI